MDWHWAADIQLGNTALEHNITAVWTVFFNNEILELLCSTWFLEKISVISPYSIKQLVFVMETFVCCEAETVFVNNV
jgi:hypothetical protein